MTRAMVVVVLLLLLACGVATTSGVTITRVDLRGSVLEKADGGAPELVQGDDGVYTLGVDLSYDFGEHVEGTKKRIVTLDRVEAKATLEGADVPVTFEATRLTPELKWPATEAGKTFVLAAQGVDETGVKSNQVKLGFVLTPNRAPELVLTSTSYSGNRLTARLTATDADQHRLASITCEAFLDGGRVDTASFSGGRGTASGSCALDFPSVSMGQTGHFVFRAGDSRDAGVELVRDLPLVP